MSEDVVRRFYDAWNNRNATAVAELFATDGHYGDPLDHQPLTGPALERHITRFLDVLPDLKITADAIVGDAGIFAVEWTLDATCRGSIDAELVGHGVSVRLRGVDVLRTRDGALVEVRRTFDRRALAEALGLQTIVEPIADGTMTFGYSVRDWVSRAKPGLLGMTWIAARDEAEKTIIRAHARDIVKGFHDVPGFIGIVTGFAGLHGFTLTAWENEEALRAGTHGPAHTEVMQAFRRDKGLAGGVFTSVWAPHHLNRNWTRCTHCGHANDATREGGQCERCGHLLPEREPYI